MYIMSNVYVQYTNMVEGKYSSHTHKTAKLWTASRGWQGEGETQDGKLKMQGEAVGSLYFNWYTQCT